jgi:hypothetical protein
MSDITPHKLKDDLDALLAAAEGQPVTFQKLIDVLGDRGHAVLILLIASPFLIIPIPGLSTAIGGVLIILSIGLMIGMNPWLPGFIARRQIAFSSLTKIIHGADRVLGKVEKWFHPRMDWLLVGPMHVLIGFSLFMACVALALPIPIPGNNIPPAVVIVTLALGLLERDGVMILVGHILNLILWIVLAVFAKLIWIGIVEAWEKVRGILG